MHLQVAAEQILGFNKKKRNVALLEWLIFCPVLYQLETQSQQCFSMSNEPIPQFGRSFDSGFPRYIPCCFPDLYKSIETTPRKQLSSQTPWGLRYQSCLQKPQWMTTCLSRKKNERKLTSLPLPFWTKKDSGTRGRGDEISASENLVQFVFLTCKLRSLPKWFLCSPNSQSSNGMSTITIVTFAQSTRALWVLCRWNVLREISHCNWLGKLLFVCLKSPFYLFKTD